MKPWWTIGIDLKPDHTMVDCEVKLVSAHSLKAVIERHNLKPDGEGNYQITDEMVDEAGALDKKNGVIQRGLRFITTRTH